MATSTRQWAKWGALCALFVALLAATGCSSQAELASPAPGEPSPIVSPLADNPTRPPSIAAQPSRTAASPTATSPPPPTPMPTPTPTPALRQLTGDGCCTQPFWSPDSRWVLFIDKPDPAAPVGIWGVDVARPAPRPELLTERIAFYTADMDFIMDLSEDMTIVERLTAPLTGTVSERWTVQTGGLPVYISPDRKRIAWEDRNYDEPYERRITELWVADLDGSDARIVATLNRGGFGDWISDDLLLLSGRESLWAREQVFFTLSLTDGRKTELARSERLRGGALSPDNAWLAYYVAQSDDLAENGLWLVRTDGSARHKLDRDLFGAYKWRDADRLLIIPFRPEAVSHELWELNINTWETRRLTDPGAIPFKIANGDWTVSPDGRHVSFVESRDRNIWLLTLTD